MWAWAYPSVSDSQRQYASRKIAVMAEKDTEFLYVQWQRQWYYLMMGHVGDGDKLHAMVTDVTILIITKDFHPEKYRGLCSLFLKSYKTSGSPVPMLKSYLSVFTRGRCQSDNNGTFIAKDFSTHSAYSCGDMNAIITNFGMESILLYTAMLLKKRIAVYHSNLTQLQDFIRIIPALAWHRQNWSVLFPFVDLIGEEVDELKNSTSYVAGFTSSSIESREDLYDVFVNVPNNEITIATHAKESFTMGKVHKDMAKHMMQCAASNSDSTIQEIASKSRDLLNNLHSFSKTDENGQAHIRLEDLKERKMAAATENFLYRLAICEGLVKL